MWTLLVCIRKVLIGLHSFIEQWLYSPMLGPGLFFSFIIFFTQTVGLLGRKISSSQSDCLHTEQHKHRVYAHRYLCPEWDSKSRKCSKERTKTVHALDRTATVVGPPISLLYENLYKKQIAFFGVVRLFGETNWIHIQGRYEHGTWKLYHVYDMQMAYWRLQNACELELVFHQTWINTIIIHAPAVFP
jgi:hypothetical protein